ncbi:MAG: hypothetical protein WBB31_14985, partial [Saprospiraceae bacterium]
MKLPHLIPTIFASALLLSVVNCKPSNDGSTTESSPLLKMMEKNIQPPIAAKKPKELSTLGHTRMDNYYWLNDRDNPEVIDYLNAENLYLDT